MFLRRAVLLLALAFLATTALAQSSTGSCDLAITVSCDTTSCTAMTTNNGTVACSGNFISGFVATAPPSAVGFSNITNTLGAATCINNNLLPSTTQAVAYCIGDASLQPGASFTDHVSLALNSSSPSSLPIIGLTIVLTPVSNEETAYVYAIANITTPTCTPGATVPPVTQSGVGYNVSWSQVASQNTSYQIDESTTSDFSSGVTTQQVNGTTASYSHTATSSAIYYYRVRSTQCGQEAPGPYSPTVQVTVQAPAPAVNVSTGGRGVDNILPFGTQTSYSFPLFIPPPSGKTTVTDTTSFSVSVDKTYITAVPSSGTVGPNGTTVTVTVNPTGLPPGASTGTVNVTNPTTGQTLGNVPVSVSLVTPLTPAGKTLPPGNALIIPVVTHVNGATSPFQSDVRITNANAAPTTYQVTFTPTQTDATTSSKSTQVTIDAGRTVALNDIAKDFFGYGASGNSSDTGFGSLEIRPLNTTSTLTYASSRTYATTSQGTFGQFIPATPFSQFATNASLIPIGGGVPSSFPVLSLQQIAQSARFRTNLGLVEGSGAPASGNIKIYDDSGNLKKTVPYSQLAGEHQQLNQFLAANGISLDDGRIEITIESSTGAVFAYASVLDNVTTDPLAVAPVQVANVNATTWVLPGMADLPTGTNNFHSDIRIYNGGSSAVTTTATYYPQGNGTPVTRTIQVAAGAVTAIDNVLPTTFNVTGSGGSIVLTTPSPAQLVATGRTYSIRSDGGTFGQFIPGVSPPQGIGVGDKPLQVLQLEESQNFRSNLGLAELTGNPAHVKLTLFLPDSKVIPTVEYDLAPYQFLQIGRIMASLNPGQPTYNGRISVQVTTGPGRVTAYGSVIDNVTQDPTYVPAQ